MLVSRIKPCKPKSNCDIGGLRTAHYIRGYLPGKLQLTLLQWITWRNAKLIHVRHVMFAIKLLWGNPW